MSRASPLARLRMVAAGGLSGAIFVVALTTLPVSSSLGTLVLSMMAGIALTLCIADGVELAAMSNDNYK